MQIVLLGIFCSKSFEDLKNIFGQKAVYSCSWEKLSVNEHLDSSVLRRVNWALSQCEQIVFDITHIKFSRWRHESFEESITLNELLLVITTPEYLEKVTFFKKGTQVEKDVVIKKVLFNRYFKNSE